ncbi:hypothetical protein [Streptomyces sp. NPDC047985]|uniref:hypothetical protein n=1 Tax=unclassified Streptomyces TaxID=2593676 RepID=UPI00342877C7
MPLAASPGVRRPARGTDRARHGLLLFTDGTVPALWLGAGAVAPAALVALLVPGRGSAPAPESRAADGTAGERVLVAA